MTAPEVPTPEAIERWGCMWWLESPSVPDCCRVATCLPCADGSIWIYGHALDRQMTRDDCWRGPLLERPPPRPVEPDNWVERLAKRKGVG